jgi:methylmalonyl-CoA mutase
MSEQEEPLASEFASPTREDWLKLVAEVLGRGDVGERLSSQTPDGLIIPPLATRADRRGAAPPLYAARGAGWDIRQRHAEPDAERANVAIREDLAGGVGSLLLQIEAPGQAGIGYGRGALGQALSGVPRP